MTPAVSFKPVAETSSVAPYALCAAGIFAASGIDAVFKGAALTFPLLSLILWRFLWGAALLLPIYLSRPTAPFSRRNLQLHVMRGVAQAATALAYFYSLTRIGLAEATVISFTAGLWVVPLSALLLREPVRWISVVAIAMGFGGSVLAVSGRPVEFSLADERWLGIAAAIVAAVSYALTLVLMRLQTRTDDPLSILTFSNIVPALVLLPVVLAVDPPPRPMIVPVGALLAVLGVLTWWLLTLAYRRAEAQQLAPIDYTALIWSALFGFWFFSEVPGWQLYAGAALIVTGCLIVLFRRRPRSRRAVMRPLAKS